MTIAVYLQTLGIIAIAFFGFVNAAAKEAPDSTTTGELWQPVEFQSGPQTGSPAPKQRVAITGSRILLLSSEQDIAASTTAKDLGKYLNEIADAVDTFFGTPERRTSRELTIHLMVLPAETIAVGVAAKPELSPETVDDLRRALGNVPRLSVKGLVKLDYIVDLWGAGGQQGCSAVPPGKQQAAPAQNAASAPSNNAQPPNIATSTAESCLLRRVDPVYPPLARQARVQGTVTLQARIGTDGAVEKLEVLSGHPMLIPSAMEAVKQWRYKPYYIDGIAVPVLTTIIVNFTLSTQP